jgi:hypothetical protein
VEPAGKYIRHPNGVLELSAPGDAGAGTFNHDSSFMADRVSSSDRVTTKTTTSTNTSTNTRCRSAL